MGPPSNSTNLPRLLRNLGCIDAIDAALGQRIRLPVDDQHVVGSDGDTPLLRAGRATIPLLSSIEDHHLPPQTDQPHQYLLFGLGLGEGLRELLRRSPYCQVTVWERDPWMMRLALGRHDYRQEIRSGRVSFLLGPDLISLRGRRFDAVVHHPVLGPKYAREWDFVQAPAETPCVFMVEGELFVQDFVDALRDAGNTTYTWEINRLSPEELFLAIQKLSPHLVAGINYTQGLAEACFRVGLPLAIWEIDPCLNPPQKSQTPTEHVSIFTYREANVESYQKAGFAHTRYMPLAANVRRRRPLAKHDPDLANFSSRVCFVGNSTTARVSPARDAFLSAHRRSFGPRAASDEVLETVLATQRATPTGYVIPDLLDAAHPGWREAQVKSGRVDPALWAGEIASAQRRLDLVGLLGKQGIEVWGDAGWEACRAQGARYMGRAGHNHHLRAIYAAGQIHVDIGRLYQSDIVTMRVFDVLACGSFLIAEHNDALLDLFEPGVHLETWSTPDELEEKVAWHLAHPELAHQIGQQGLSHVRENHSIRGRVSTILASVAAQKLLKAS